MMNWIWAGMIAIAIMFAFWMDLTGVPAKTQPPAIVANQSQFPDLDDPELFFDNVLGEAQPPAAYVAAYNEAGVYSGAGVFPDSEDPAYAYAVRSDVANAPLLLPYEGMIEGRAETLSAEIAGLGEGDTVAVRVRDVNGVEFFGPLEGERTGARNTFSVKIADLQVIDGGEGVQPVPPLQVVGLELTPAPRTEADLGVQLAVGAITASYPASIVAENLQSTSWMGVLTKSVSNWAKTAVDLAIGLIGILVLWMGLMRIAEKAGLVALLAKLLKPLLILLFPDVPPNSPAMGAIVMNIAANMLGLGNAATPLGLKAMQELQKDNPNKEYASNAMVMLLGINTSSVVILPASILAYRAAAGSANLMLFWPLMLAATLASTATAVIACKLLENLPMFRVPPPAPGAQDSTREEAQA